MIALGSLLQDLGLLSKRAVTEMRGSQRKKGFLRTVKILLEHSVEEPWIGLREKSE